MQVKTKILGQPGVHVEMFMGGIVIDDRMKGQGQGQGRVGLAVQLPEEAEKLIMAVPGQTFTDHASLVDVERRE